MRFSALALLFFCVPAIAGDGENADKHWSFQPRTKSAPPKFDDPAKRSWVRTPIDAFILDRLNRTVLEPAPAADRTTLIRRITFDLTGLPPTPAEVDAFLKDSTADAYGKLVERLLASPHYGEKWGRHWLDTVRYSESEGFEYDRHRPGAWRFRDYVVDSFNADKPYDKFVIEQLAGDELESPTQEQRIAAGFNRLGPVRRNAGNQEFAFSRNEVLTEMADSAATVFLGLTVACARCHDHKFDPVSLEDYYCFQAFWAAAQEHDESLADSTQQKEWKKETDRIQSEIKATQKTLESLKGDERTKAEEKVQKLEASLPPPLPMVTTVRNVAAERTVVHVLKRGNTDKKERQVGPKLLGMISTDERELPAETAKPRSTLARAIIQPDNPLTARVMVNRIWQGHFGTGLVATANDFGVNGSRPTHPELLDWLAGEFIASKWSVKHLHLLIVMSSTYRQASRRTDTKAASKDPDDRLLWRFPRRRLSAEEVRDSMLSVSGRLNLKAGGPSVVTPIENDLVKLLYTPSQWIVTPDKREHDRRSVYLLAKRNFRLPFMSVFDQPDAASSCDRRESSTHALQTLELLNGSLANDLAGTFAEKLRRDAGNDPAAQVELAYRRAAGRAPTRSESDRAVEFLKTQPLREFALAVFNLNAFLYVE